MSGSEALPNAEAIKICKEALAAMIQDKGHKPFAKVFHALASQPDLKRDLWLALSVLHPFVEHKMIPVILHSPRQAFEVLRNCSEGRILSRTGEYPEWNICRILIATSLTVFELRAEEESERAPETAFRFFNKAFQINR